VTAVGRSRIAARARGVGLLILDVDGVLTDGRLIYGSTGEELKVFHVRDGHAIVSALAAGLAVSVVSGRSSAAVARRMADLGVTEVHQGVSDKLALLGALCGRHGVDAGAAAFMGDDLPDLPLLRAVGLALAPADADPAVRRVAHWVSRRGGGAGAVREAIEWLLRARAASPLRER
jgi:3-deoxy-D-manno-octulosonate 8-phosphate phosphatase (KDO 8-P phosphatase)